MNGSGEDRRFDLPEFWSLLEELEEGALDVSRCEEVAALLDRSPAARRAYLEYFQQSAVLRMEAAKLHERGLLPVVGSGIQTRRAVRRSVLAAAAVVALAALVAALIVVAGPEPVRLAAVVAADTSWSIDGVNQGYGAEPVSVAAGSTILVRSGTARLELESGDLLVIQGPAEVSFPEPHRPQLRHGWLWIDAERSDETFEVEARNLRIRDIGTRFGVRVAQNGQVEVHLITGKVEVRSEGRGKPTVDLSEAGSAVTFSADGGMAEIPPATDPFPALPELLRRPPDYRTVVLGQSPAGYWPLDEDTGEELASLVADDPDGFKGKAFQGGEAGPGADSGFHGLPSANRALRLDGSNLRSVVSGIGGLHGVSRREGAVSFWFRRAADEAPRDEMLWLAGAGVRTVPDQAILHTRLTASGKVIFRIENGNDDVSLSSSRLPADGRWHHVAASWGPESVDLYIDGQLAARDGKPRILEAANLFGRYVRFGKPSDDLAAELGAFTGWVDEIVLWNRPLSPTEVGIQFRAAIGSARLTLRPKPASGAGISRETRIPGDGQPGDDPE